MASKIDSAPGTQTQSTLPLAGLIAQLSQLQRERSNLEQFAPNALAILARSTNLAAINLFLLKGNKKSLHLQAGLWTNKIPSKSDADTFTTEVLETTNIIKQAFRAGTPQHGQQPPYTKPQAMANGDAEFAIPLHARNLVMGVLHLVTYDKAQPSETEFTNLNIFAAQLALSIENIQLRTAIQRRSYEQKILLETNAALNSNLQSDRVLELLAKKIAQTLDGGACIISCWHETNHTLTPIAQHIRAAGHSPSRTWRDLGRAMPLAGDPVGRQVLKTMRPIAIQNGTKTKDSGWTKHGWQSILAFPLQSHKKKLGLIEVYDQRPDRTFTLEDIQLGKALASQATIAIGQITLFQQTQQRLTEVSTLYTLSRQIISATSLNLAELLKNLVNTIKQIVNCRACVLFLLDEKREFLEIKAASGLKKHWETSARLAVGEGAAGQAVIQKKTIYIPDAAEDTSFIFFDDSIRSLIVVPMMVQDQVIGTINLDDITPHAFGQSQERLLSIAANHAAIAIQSATLFQQVLSEEQRMRAIIEHMADGLLMLDKAGEIVKVNPVLSVMLGMHSTQMIGQNIHVDHLDPRLKTICKPLPGNKKGGILTDEVTLPGQNTPILRIYASAVTDENSLPIGEVRIVHDITQQRELERMKDDFISTVSHELRTPLFSIQGFVRLILNGDVPNPHTQQEFLTIIERQANQLAELVTNLLDLNRMSTNAFDIEKQPIRLIDVINQTILRLQGFAHKKKVNLRSQLPTTLPIIMGDAQRLEQIMTNLVGNAIKFTPINGKVTVKAKITPKHIVVSVVDTGIGIDESELDRIFSKFYQVEEHSTRSVTGSGLGLHISKQLAEKHSGKLWAESQLGNGSTFYLQLPIASPEAISGSEKTSRELHE